MWRVRFLGELPYQAALAAMQAVTCASPTAGAKLAAIGISHPEDARHSTETGSDHPAPTNEIWVLSHPPVYTQGTRDHDLPATTSATGMPYPPIEVVKTDRGGLITYHGPGQLVMYLLLDIKALGLGAKSLVNRVEASIIDMLAAYGIQGERQPGAPGVYVQGAKVAALGLRIRNGRCYHGLSINVDMDLSPFERIDPCGYAGLPVTQMRDLVHDPEGGQNEQNLPLDLDTVAHQMLRALDAQLTADASAPTQS